MNYYKVSYVFESKKMVLGLGIGFFSIYNSIHVVIDTSTVICFFKKMECIKHT